MKQRLSANGFRCVDCGKFVYVGYDSRDLKGVKGAVCIYCSVDYEPKERLGDGR